MNQGALDAWFKGHATPRRTNQSTPHRAWRLVLLGAPGIGKGTQAALLQASLGAAHLSTGDLFRAARSVPTGSQTPSIREALAHMSAGRLVPDQTVIEMVRERASCLCSGDGFLLDGFPRTVPQAEALDELLDKHGIALDAVLSYDLPDDRVVERIAGRRVCANCSRSYHVRNLPPRAAGICDRCEGPLVHRDDDRPAAVRVRLETYHQITEPVISYYRSRELLIRIDCSNTPSATLDMTLRSLPGS